MQYIGGKQNSGGQRIAATIRRFAERVDTRLVVEPFCGGLSVTQRLQGLNVYARDACGPLITLYRALLLGWEPPAEVDRATWERYKTAPDPDDPMTAFVGFGCSWSGAWFSGYTERFKRHGSNYVPAATAARDSLRKKITACAGCVVGFNAGDYADAPVHGVWYCDIPYADSLGYPAVGPFDHARFWAFVADVAQHVPVIVSERQAPAPFVMIDEWSVQRRLNTPTATRRMERLFVHERWT